MMIGMKNEVIMVMVMVMMVMKKWRLKMIVGMKVETKVRRL